MTATVVTLVAAPADILFPAFPRACAEARRVSGQPNVKMTG